MSLKSKRIHKWVSRYLAIVRVCYRQGIDDPEAIKSWVKAGKIPPPEAKGITFVIVKD